MGRNTGGDSIIWTLLPSGGTYKMFYYCQQHAQWDTRTNATLPTAFAQCRNEIQTEHGCIEQ